MNIQTAIVKKQLRIREIKTAIDKHGNDLDINFLNARIEKLQLEIDTLENEHIRLTQ